MKCPYCGYLESKVVDSRPADEGASIRRRRESSRSEAPQGRLYRSGMNFNRGPVQKEQVLF